MKFRELVNKYKNGLATEDEIQLIEQEIEKHEAIEEYLAEDKDFNFTESLKNEDLNEESIKLRKSLNNKLRKVVFTSVSVVIVLILGIIFIISPLINSLYYNPTKISVGSKEIDIDYDMYALTELNLSGHNLSSQVHVDKLGFGEYDISYYRTNFFTQESNYVNSKIKRGHNITNHTKFTDDNHFNFTTIKYPDSVNSENVKEQKERVISHVRQLSPVSYISSCLTFEKDFTMEELHQLILKYPAIDFIWAGIRTDPSGERINDLIGFRPRRTSGPFSGDKPDEGKYPAFFLLEWLVNPTYDGGELYLEPKGYELHYKDLLRYMIDRKEAVEVLDKHPRMHEYYKKALDYAQEHGVKTYGVLAYSNAKNLIELVENESIMTLELNNIMASKKYID